MAMKVTSLLPFFFFLLASFTTTGEKVYDNEGSPLNKASKYSILPSGSHQDKVIAVKQIYEDRHVCGLFVSVASKKEEPLPVKISTKADAISTHSPVNFSFVEAVPSNCTKSNQTQWVVGETLPPPPYVMIGDPRETNHFIRNGSFFIDGVDDIESERNHTYALSFCDEKEKCALVGVQGDGRMILLTEEDLSLKLIIKFHLEGPPPPTPSPPPPMPSPPPPTPSPPPPMPSPPPPTPSPPPPTPTPPTPSPPPPTRSPPPPPPPSPSPPPPPPPSEEVYDTECHPLDKGSKYSILPSKYHQDKVITVKQIYTDLPVCGLFVSVASKTKPLPVKISPEAEAIYINKPSNFSFVEVVPSKCTKSNQTQWVIGETLPPIPYVMIGDPRETQCFVRNGSFYIKRADDNDKCHRTYTLSFCEKLERRCATVGVQEDGRMILLRKEEEKSLKLVIKFHREGSLSPPSPPSTLLAHPRRTITRTRRGRAYGPLSLPYELLNVY